MLFRSHRPGVGLNLGEHVAIRSGPIYLNDSSLLPKIKDGDEAELERYLATGEGLLGEIGSGAQALLVSSRAKAAGQSNWPDIQISLAFRWNGLGSADNGDDYLRLSVVNMRSLTRGSVRLNTTAWRLGERDDEKLAIVDLQMLADSSAVDVLVEGIKFGLGVF